MSIKDDVAAMIDALRDHDPDAPGRARELLSELRELREFGFMIDLAEALSRVEPNVAKTRRLYAQALIETGKATAAVDVLLELKRRLPDTDAEAVEATGLLGRACKQIHFDARVRGSPAARQALQDAIAFYRSAYAVDTRRTWHGVNLLALVEYCRRNDKEYPERVEPAALAAQLLATLAAKPAGDRDWWDLATIAEATLTSRDWGAIESSIQNCANDPRVTAFQLGSMIRQLTEVWELDKSGRGGAMIQILSARKMMLPKASLEVPADRVLQSLPSEAHFQAVLGGQKGTRTYKWWATGLQRAGSVAAIRRKLGGRLGSGFLVNAADFTAKHPGELLVLTNYHVVNEAGLNDGLRPEEAEVVFEGIDPGKTYEVDSIVWSSPPEECDASLLRLAAAPQNIAALKLARALPVLEASAPQPQVYVIGHPGGLDLAYSFDDNEIIDHEGPTAGKPVIPGVSRVHYRAETEGGSSGSPVFNSSWDVIALHHKGGKLGMPRLNGLAGTYGANEGIWIQSIIAKSKGS